MMDLSLSKNNIVSGAAFISWRDGPDGRGTLNILISCVGTLILCVWTAMHLNISPRAEPTWRSYWTYTKWVFLGLIGPELVVWTAWRQFISARSLLHESKQPNAWRNMRRPSNSKASASWTMTHGFYAGMGGFVIDLDDDDQGDQRDEFIPGHDRLVVTSKGIDLLARCGHLPVISQEDILDKSKTDALGKMLAAFQGSWMLVQVVARLCLGLPLTLLEVLTVAHVLCAFLIYMFWWNKPRLVTQPTRLRGPWVRPILAFMYMSSRASLDEQNRPGFLSDLTLHTEIAYLIYHEAEEAGRTSDPERSRSTDKVPTKTSITEINTTEENLTSNNFFRMRTPLESASGSTSDLEGSTAILHAGSTQRRHHLALSAIATYPALRRLFKPVQDECDTRFESALRHYPEMPLRARKGYKRMNHGSATSLDLKEGEGKGQRHNKSDFPSPTGFSFYGEQYVAHSADNWPNDDLFRRTEGLLMGCVLWFATIGYSAVHIAAWHAEFPSTVEGYLWRAAALFVGGSGLLWLLIHVLGHFSARVWWVWYDIMASDANRVVYVLLGVLCSICGVLYILARLYLPIEAFVSLRWLPVTAFETPNWVLTVPHFN